MAEQAKLNPALKSRMGDMRREIKKCIGQLTGGAPGVNRQQVRAASVLIVSYSDVFLIMQEANRTPRYKRSPGS